MVAYIKKLSCFKLYHDTAWYFIKGCNQLEREHLKQKTGYMNGCAYSNIMLIIYAYSSLSSVCVCMHVIESLGLATIEKSSSYRGGECSSSFIFHYAAHSDHRHQSPTHPSSIRCTFCLFSRLALSCSAAVGL